MRVISASRRTDIPAFYSKWLMGRLEAGFCHFINPFSGKVYRAPLAPEEVLAIAFLTRDAEPLLPYLPALSARGYHFFFHYTITGYPSLLEPAVPRPAKAVDTFRRTARLVPPGMVQWRYDPVLISSLTPPSYHVARFEALARSLEGYTNRCYLSFAQFYGKTKRNLAHLAERGLVVREPSGPEKRELAAALAEIGAKRGIELYSCCDPDLVWSEGPPGGAGPLAAGACVDPDIVRALRPDLTLQPKPGPTREGCGCMEATDIGGFDTCGHGCAYCYATTSHRVGLLNLEEHDPADTILHRPRSLRGLDLSLQAVELSPPRTQAHVDGQLGLF